MSFSSNNANNGSDGRARGYSMPTGSPGTQPRRSALSEAIAEERKRKPEAGSSGTTNVRNEDETAEGRPRSHSKPINISNSADFPETKLSAGLARGNEGFRNWTTGYPAKKSFLQDDADIPDCFKISRRSPPADKVELDVLLKTAMIDYEGRRYFPLTADTVHDLSPFWKESKPVSEVGIFNRIMIDKEVNAIHADHVVSALKRIGEHCHHLVILAPIQTSELGNVFAREEGNIYPGNDWDHLLRFFPALTHLVFIHPNHIPFDLSINSLESLHAAVARRQAVRAFEEVSIRVPSALLAATAHSG